MSAQVQGLYELGKSLALRGSFKAADEKFKQVIAEPYLYDTDKELLYLAMKSRLELNLDDETQRAEITRQMVSSFVSEPDYTERVLYDVAQTDKMLGNKENYENALQLIIDTVAKPSDHIYLELALIQLDRKNCADAAKNFLTYLNKVGKQGVNVELAALNLAHCHNSLNQPDQAQKILKRYLNLK